MTPTNDDPPQQTSSQTPQRTPPDPAPFGGSVTSLGFPGLAVGLQTQVWNGPFPPPQAVESYERALPGSFDRIIKMAEERQRNELALASKATNAAIADTLRANWMGYSINVLALALAALFVMTGHTGAGVLAIVIQGIVAGTSIFLRREQRRAAAEQTDGTAARPARGSGR